MKNDFSVDTSKQVKKEFLKKIEKPLNVALFLTGIETIVAVVYFISGISRGIWNEIGICDFVTKSVHYLSIICIFISLVKLIADEKPFSHSLVVCMRIVSILYLVGSVAFPRLPGYETNYNILKFGDFTLIDGNTLIIGLMLYIFSIMIHEGFDAQKEIEEMI